VDSRQWNRSKFLRGIGGVGELLHDCLRGREEFASGAFYRLGNWM
jgi:hypothetical protein